VVTWWEVGMAGTAVAGATGLVGRAVVAALPTGEQTRSRGASAHG
jgi:hypothetical protein